MATDPDNQLSPYHFASVFSLSPNTPALSTYLSSLHPTGPTAQAPIASQIKTYPDAAYHTYLPLGFDLVYAPSNSSADGDGAKAKSWELDRIDIYNPIPTPQPATSTSPVASGSRQKRPAPQYSPPALPMTIRHRRGAPPPGTAASSDLSAGNEISRNDVSTAQPSTAANASMEAENGDNSSTLSITSRTTGRDFVEALGEPSRKGGGTGWVGPWLEWSRLRILPPNSGLIDVDSSLQEETKGEEQEEVEMELGMMVELRESGLAKISEEDMKKGLGGVWDRAGGWEWGCIKFFRVGSTT